MLGILFNDLFCKSITYIHAYRTLWSFHAWFPCKTLREHKKYMNVKCVVTMCMFASVTVDSLCLRGVLEVLQVLISLLAPVKYIMINE